MAESLQRPIERSVGCITSDRSDRAATIQQNHFSHAFKICRLYFFRTNELLHVATGNPPKYASFSDWNSTKRYKTPILKLLTSIDHLLTARAKRQEVINLWTENRCRYHQHRHRKNWRRIILVNFKLNKIICSPLFLIHRYHRPS